MGLSILCHRVVSKNLSTRSMMEYMINKKTAVVIIMIDAYDKNDHRG